MSPRKSSTSYGKPILPRPRYLGIEVAGELLRSPRGLERELRQRLPSSVSTPGTTVRIVRLTGSRAIVEVEHTLLHEARLAWNRPGPPVALRTVRTWGTLRGAKAWASGRAVRRQRPVRRSNR